MDICVFGSGYVGLILGVCLSELGHNVMVVDKDKEKIEKLNRGIPTIYEIGLEDLLKRNLKEKRIKFFDEGSEAIKSSEVIFIAVGTPMKEDGSADLKYVKEVALEIGQNINGYKVIVDKSTVPVGTAENVAKIIGDESKNKFEFDVVSNPEFLKEGCGIKDFMAPDRIVIGAESERAIEVMKKVYSGLIRTQSPFIVTNVKSAEIIKYASNAMLATRISFMNMVANLCEKVGGDIKAVSKGVGMDDRIGPRFLQAGVGYGGSCFPKDVNAFIKTLKDNFCDATILESVENVNNYQKKSIINKIEVLVPDFKGKTITIWGLAFKPKTDDVRKAPAVYLIKQLIDRGAKVNAFDPEAKDKMKEVFPNINYFDNPYDSLKNSDCLVILTEWDEFRSLSHEKMKSIMKNPNIFDGRNIYYGSDIEKMGFNYVGIGVSIKIN